MTETGQLTHDTATQTAAHLYALIQQNDHTGHIVSANAIVAHRGRRQSYCPGRPPGRSAAPDVRQTCRLARNAGGERFRHNGEDELK